MESLFTTDGRIPRSTYWKYYVFVYATFFILGAVQNYIPEEILGIVSLLLIPALLVGVFVQVKRWHDLDKSGWWILINVVPIIGAVWSLVECGFVKGTEGPNRFGRDPLRPKYRY